MQLFQLLQLLFSCFMGSLRCGCFPAPLSEKEQEQMIIRMLRGDPEARASLIEHNLRLVAHIVKKYELRHDQNEDLISTGTIGLIKGIDSYDPKKGNKLSSYIARCIENEILMSLRSAKKYSREISLDEPISQDSDGSEMTLMDILADPQPVDPVQHVCDNEKREQLAQALKTLNCRERKILIRRYGLDQRKPMTQKEIAAQDHISRSYVCRIEKKALTKLIRSLRRQQENS